MKSRTRFKNLWKLKFFFRQRWKCYKHCKYIKNIFFGFLLFFTIFGFSEKFINKKVGQKLGNNRCPLFTILTKQNSSMFCIVSFVKNKKKMISLSWATCSHTHTSLFSRRATCPHILKVVYFQGRPAHTLTLSG